MTENGGICSNCGRILKAEDTACPVCQQPVQTSEPEADTSASFETLIQQAEINASDPTGLPKKEELTWLEEEEEVAPKSVQPQATDSPNDPQPVENLIQQTAPIKVSSDKPRVVKSVQMQPRKSTSGQGPWRVSAEKKVPPAPPRVSGWQWVLLMLEIIFILSASAALVYLLAGMPVLNFSLNRPVAISPLTDPDLPEWTNRLVFSDTFDGEKFVFPRGGTRDSIFRYSSTGEYCIDILKPGIGRASKPEPVNRSQDVFMKFSVLPGGQAGSVGAVCRDAGERVIVVKFSPYYKAYAIERITRAGVEPLSYGWQPIKDLAPDSTGRYAVEVYCIADQAGIRINGYWADPVFIDQKPEDRGQSGLYAGALETETPVEGVYFSACFDDLEISSP